MYLSVTQLTKRYGDRVVLDGVTFMLDEPTNHISLDVLEKFERALLGFPGAILAVSHDRRFIERFAGAVWTLHEGRLTRDAQVG